MNLKVDPVFKTIRSDRASRICCTRSPQALSPDVRIGEQRPGLFEGENANSRDGFPSDRGDTETLWSKIMNRER